VATNGKILENGNAGSVPAETLEYRRRVVSLLVLGNPADAESAYYTAPGTTFEGWQYLVRVCVPVRAYLETGDAPYLSTGNVDIWTGVTTPQGDCAEDGMPLGYQNETRRQQEAEWFERKISR
jgi:hypothetical protein